MNISYRDAINRVLYESMLKDETIFLIGEDIGRYGGAFGVTKRLLNKFGKERVIDAPISELSMMGVAVGAAMLKLKPIVEIMFMDFITLAMDQIVNHLAKYNFIYGGQVRLPLVIRTAAGAGKSYGATHSQSLESWFLHVPGLKVVAPNNPYDAAGLLRSCIKQNSPTLFIEHKLLYNKQGEFDRRYFEIPIGKANLISEGDDVTLISYSSMLDVSRKAAESLLKDGIECDILDLRTISPLDIDCIIKSVKKTGRAVIVEEGTLSAGIGAEIAAQIQDRGFEYLNAPIKRVAAPDIPVPFAKSLEDFYLPNSSGIIDAVLEVIEYR